MHFKHGVFLHSLSFPLSQDALRRHTMSKGRERDSTNKAFEVWLLYWLLFRIDLQNHRTSERSAVTICSNDCFWCPLVHEINSQAGFISVHWHISSATGGVFYLQECRNPHTNPSLRTGSRNWAIPVFSWVANKERQQAGPQLNFPASDRVCGHRSSAEKDAEENKQLEEVRFPVTLPSSCCLCQFICKETPSEKIC